MNNIKRIMLGHLAENITFVILTPLKSSFNKLIERLNIEDIYDNAFFKNCVFKIEKTNKKGLLVLSPQGIASKDIIELFSNINILFFGLAGSLNKQLEIGSFVEVQSAVNQRKENINLYTTGKYKKVKCGYSPCLLGNIAERYCNLARTMNCDVVDMETSCCAETALENSNKFISLLLISDIPNVTNFWKLSEEEQKKLKEARLDAIEKIIEYIDVLSERNLK